MEVYSQKGLGLFLLGHLGSLKRHQSNCFVYLYTSVFLALKHQIKTQLPTSRNHSAALSFSHVRIGVETLRAKLESFLWMSQDAYG